MFSSMALWQLAFLGLLGGVVIAILMVWRGPRGGAISEAGQNPEIRIDKIPIKGGIGAAVLIIVLLAGVLLDLPALRWLALRGQFGAWLSAAFSFCGEGIMGVKRRATSCMTA